MLIEKLVSCVTSKKYDEYLRFDADASYVLPQKKSTQSSLMLYMHVPFCETLCTYCSFHRVTFQEDLAKAHFAALRKEAVMYKERGYDFNSVYVGGGTPTVLIDELADTLNFIKELFNIKEISVETNPNHLNMDKMKILKETGVNRLSVGVQSFDDEILRLIGRYHKYGSGQQMVEKIAALEGFFDTLNVDMIFNFPSQTESKLQYDLNVLRELKVDQITFYPLMVSSATRKLMIKKLGRISDVHEKTFYKMITETLREDYAASTAWCFSRVNSEESESLMIDEYVINHDEYAGLGSGAISYLNGSIFVNSFDIKEYINKIEQGKFLIEGRRDFSLKEKLLYDFLMQFFGLSLNLNQLSQKHGVNASMRLWLEILLFTMVGAVKREGDRLTLTSRGQYYWVVMMREFFTSVDNFRDYCRAKANLTLDINEGH